MTFLSLQESLRRELRQRMESGELSGTELARRTGFTQAHISNFLNRKRGLKLKALDVVLKALGMSVLELARPEELARYAPLPPLREEQFVAVPLVDHRTAATTAVISSEEVRELFHYKRAFLERLRADLAASGRREWTRFVVLRAEARDAAAMAPRIQAGALLLVDRHYVNPRPYRRKEANLYVVAREATRLVRYVELEGDLLVLRPQSPAYPVETIHIEPWQSAADWIVGRIAQIAIPV